MFGVVDKQIGKILFVGIEMSGATGQTDVALIKGRSFEHFFHSSSGYFEFMICYYLSHFLLDISNNCSFAGSRRGSGIQKECLAQVECHHHIQLLLLLLL